MDASLIEQLPEFLTKVGLSEAPLGVLWTDRAPTEGFTTPKPIDLPTREKELANQIDWQSVFGSFSCAMGHIWRARKKQTAAYFSAERFGCPGAAFWLGFNKPQTETIIRYVSSGIPNWTEGEHYCESPDALRQIFEFVDPPPAPKSYCVLQPLTRFNADETPELVVFFTRPEVLCGLHQLAAFVTNDPEVVASPWSAGCGGLVAWPRHYLARGRSKAVIGGWDPSARKFYKTDELSFTVPYAIFESMVGRYEASFLTTKTWQTVAKKIARSRKAWNEQGPAEP
ncbi:MAG: DUF169 domain-containing protein [Desulfosarcinaceae bacterium]|jgi:uncharacterized protein (DUF169 family)